MRIATVDLEGVDLVCADGQIRTFFGCSIEGVFEFEERLSQIQAKLDQCPPDQPVEELYWSDRIFRHYVDRCLLLNGVKPAWVRWYQVEQLLFASITESGEVQSGYLIQLNRRSTGTPNQNAEPLSKAELIGAIAAQVVSVEEALRLARNEPASLISDVLNAKAEASKPQKDKQRSDMKKWMQRKREEAKKKEAG